LGIFLAPFQQPFANCSEAIQQPLGILNLLSKTLFAVVSGCPVAFKSIFASSYQQKCGNVYPFSLRHMMGLCPSIHHEPKSI
jgi:hypothetical protein